MGNKSGFCERGCPYCGLEDIDILVSMSAKKIAEMNWSYHKNYSEMLGINESEKYPIVRCRSCEFVYAQLLPPRAFLAELYDNVITLDTDMARVLERKDLGRRFEYLSILLNLVHDHSDSHPILDYGAGYGQVSAILTSLGIRVVAYDTSERRTSRLKNVSSIVAMDKEEIRRNGPYCAIICDNVLEHVSSPRSLVDLFQETLVPGGILFVSVPSYEGKQINKSLSMIDMSINPWEHLSYFDLQHLDGMMLDCNFVAVHNDEIGRNIDVGLRPEKDFYSKIKNGAASGARIVKYIFNRPIMESVSRRFYRLGLE